MTPPTVARDAHRSIPRPTVADLLRAAPFWSQEEEQRGQARLAALLPRGTAPATPVDAFLTAFHTYLQETTSLPAPPNVRVLGYRLLPTRDCVAPAVAAVTRFAEVVCLPDPPAGQDLQIASALYCELMAQWLRKRGQAVSCWTLLRNATVFPAVFEVTFPGYIHSGFARRAFQRLRGRRVPHPTAPAPEE